jgi:predicted RNA binding protein YcfA (HicA-like mRNA interferase family)
MPKLGILKPQQVIAALERAGFRQVRQKGSHIQLKRGNLLVTVPNHTEDLNPITLKSILR